MAWLVPILLVATCGSQALTSRDWAGIIPDSATARVIHTPQLPLGATPASAMTSAAAGVAPAAVLEPLVTATDLVYEGSIRLPQGTIGGSSFDYGGTALSFNPDRGSLFIVGHNWQQQIAEIALPEIRRGTSLADLAVAAVLQPFADPADGRLRSVEVNQSGTVLVGGSLPYLGKLYFTGYVYYDGDGIQELSHFVSGLDLSVAGDVRGPYQVGSLGAGLVSGYFGLVPTEWQAALGGPVLNGQCCLSIISRTSFGPAAFAVDPTQLGAIDPLPAVPLVYYTADHQLARYDAQSTLFNSATQIGGIVFPEGTRSVLFFGKQGLGPLCYGQGTTDRSLDRTGPAENPYCYDPADSSKGYHAYPYVPYVWAYDAIDLAAVKDGLRQPWDVQPYAVWSLDLPFAGSAQILGAAYDPRTGRIFVSQAYGDGANPLIHAFTLGSGSTTPVPPISMTPSPLPPTPVPPTVSLTSPSSGQTFTPPATIRLTASASDRDGSVTAVAFYVNGGLVGTDAASPYSLNWSGTAAGTYQISAVATDNTGLTSTSSATIVVRQPDLATVTLVIPSDNATFAPGAPIEVSAAVSASDRAVTAIAIYVNDILIGTGETSPYSIAWSTQAAGEYRITAVALDDAGQTVTSGTTTVFVLQPARRRGSR